MQGRLVWKRIFTPDLVWVVEVTTRQFGGKHLRNHIYVVETRTGDHGVLEPWPALQVKISAPRHIYFYGCNGKGWCGGGGCGEGRLVGGGLRNVIFTEMTESPGFI